MIERSEEGIMDITTEPTPDLAPIHPSTLPDASPDNPLEALSWLGETVEEVAEGLRARRIKGERWEPSACPLAIYLQLWYPTACVAMGTAWEESDLGMNWTCPPGAEEFEIAFDNGNFPDLIAFDG